MPVTIIKCSRALERSLTHTVMKIRMKICRNFVVADEYVGFCRRIYRATWNAFPCRIMSKESRSLSFENILENIIYL